jgi:hypothetical protein
LYLAGAELVAAYPMGPIHEGAGLNATVLSYRYSIDFGFMGCSELIPDIWDLAKAVPEAFAELKAAAGMTPAEPPTPIRAQKRSPNGRSSTRKAPKPAPKPAQKTATKTAQKTAQDDVAPPKATPTSA